MSNSDAFAVIRNILYKPSRPLDYVQSGYRSFSSSQEGDVKRYMNGQPDKDVAADTVLNASLPFLKSDECERVKGQLSYIVQDMKEERQQSRSRGFHM